MKNKRLLQIIQASIAEFWFEWGNEPEGCVSFGKYVNDEYKFIGFGSKDWVKSLCLKHHCPHS